jgi:hypothetical protein
MKTIKIIDLLNKIANGEEVPEKIKINNVIYEYRGYMYCTKKANYQDIEDYLFGKWNFNILNDEVEIIEEDKEIEKIEQIITKKVKYNSIDELAVEISKAFETIDKLIINQNKLIDKVNSLEKNK